MPPTSPRPGRRHYGWIRLLGLGGIAVLFASAFTPLPNVLSRWVATPPLLKPADAIVVLGAGVWPEGVLSNGSLRRALHGMTLYRAGLAPLLVFLGPARAEGLAEAEIRADLARRFGIPPHAILTDTAVQTTREEALRVRAFLWPRGIRRILLVTSSQHMVRAQRLFTQAGFEVLPAPADDFSSDPDGPGARLLLMRHVLQELVGRFYYRIAGYM